MRFQGVKVVRDKRHIPQRRSGLADLPVVFLENISAFCFFLAARCAFKVSQSVSLRCGPFDYAVFSCESAL